METRLMSVRVKSFNTNKESWLDLPATKEEIDAIDIGGGYELTDSEYIHIDLVNSIDYLNLAAKGIIELESKHSERGIDLDVLCDIRRHFKFISNESFAERVEKSVVIDIEEHREFPEIWEAEEVIEKYAELNSLDLNIYVPFYFDEIIVLVEKWK